MIPNQYLGTSSAPESSRTVPIDEYILDLVLLSQELWPPPPPRWFHRSCLFGEDGKECHLIPHIGY